MRTLMVGVVLILAMATPARAQRLGPALGGYITAAFVDHTLTAYCFGAGTCQEVGPILGPLSRKTNVVTALSIKGAVNGGVVWGLVEWKDRHPKIVFWTAVGLAAGQTAADLYNIQQLRKVGRK